MTDKIFSKKDEYFLTLAMTGIHSFMMLGVVNEGQPLLLARVGKSNQIDPDFHSQCIMHEFRTFKKLG